MNDHVKAAKVALVAGQIRTPCSGLLSEALYDDVDLFSEDL